MTIPPSKSYLLFDMDGTLIDTEPVGSANFLNQLSKYGIRPTLEEQELFTKIWRRDGTSIKEDDWLPEIAHKYKINLSSEEYLKEFYAMYVDAIISASALPGVDDFLKAVQAYGKYKTAIVTASKLHQVKAILEQHGWQDTFDAVVTSEDITKFKPDPESFSVGIQKLNASSETSVVFEDSKNGAKAGKIAGCYVVGIRAGNSRPQDLSSADIVVQSFKNVNV